MGPVERAKLISLFIEKNNEERKRKEIEEREELITHESKIHPIFHRRFTIVGGHIFITSIFDPPTAVIVPFSYCCSTLVSLSFTSWKCFSPPVVRIHGIEVKRNIKQRSVIDMT